MDFLKFIEMFLHGVQLLAGAGLIVLVLLHSPKGDGIGAIGGSAHIFASQKGAEAALNKITAYFAGAFYAASFILGYYF